MIILIENVFMKHQGQDKSLDKSGFWSTLPFMAELCWDMQEMALVLIGCFQG